LRLVWKILLTLLFVAVVPVATSGVTSILLAREAVAEAASEKLAAEARHLAEVAERTILDAVNDLGHSDSLRLHRLNRNELLAALSLIYKDDPRRNVVALIDGNTGELVVDLVYQEKVLDEPGLRGHRPFTAAAEAAFAKAIPLQAAVAAGKAVSPPYVDRARGLPLIALAVAVDGPLTAAGPQPWVIAVELSLDELNKRFEEAADEQMTAVLVDHTGRTVCHTDRVSMLERSNWSPHAAVAQLHTPLAPSSGTIDPGMSTGADAVLAAWARANRLGSPEGKSWGVVVERSRADALAAVGEMSARTVFWVSTAFLIALLASFVLARGIARPIELLTHVVDRFGRGDTDMRSSIKSRDEIGRLASSFNEMADGIEERDAELQRFADDLQGRVIERTAELKEAQDQLINSQKMAAVGELGAGVAHEINNPLAGVLGSAQLALLRVDKDNPLRRHLEDIEHEALRIRDIVESLLQLSTEREAKGGGACDVNEVVDGAVSLYARSIISQRIHVKKELAKDLPKVRGRSADLQQILMQLIANARDAMPDGGTLTVRTENVDNKLAKIVVADTGQGIAEGNREKIFEPFFTTRSGEGQKGMGLAVVHRIVEEHGGRVTVDSTLGRGTEVRITFPAMREKLHLA
jgi:signal transduction histidine kinase